MGAGLARLPSLQKLDLTNSSFAYNFDAALPGERLFPALQELGLSNSCGLQHRLRPLVPLLHACAGLTSLDLRRNDIICSADDLYRELNYELASSMAGMEGLKAREAALCAHAPHPPQEPSTPPDMGARALL